MKKKGKRQIPKIGIRFYNHFMQHKVMYIVGAVFIFLCVYYLSHMHGGAHQTVMDKSIAVKISDTKIADVPVYISALGTITSNTTVNITSQVSGNLIKVVFDDGQNIQAGDPLIEIDTRAYEVQLAQAEGQLLRDMALLENARLDLQRYQKLLRDNSVSKQTFDTQASLVRQLEGTVKFDQGVVDQANLNLSYCHIKAPVSGKVGLSLLNEGNLVQVGDILVVLNTIDPISVVFSVSESVLSQLLEQSKSDSAMMVEIYDRDKKQLLVKDKLSAIDNQIDTTTGMVKLKAELPNGDGKLFPNQFVNVQLLLQTLNNALVVPTAAVQHGAGKDFVYQVVDNKAKVVPIKPGVIYDDETVVLEGLEPGQPVVIQGMDKLTDGVAVHKAEEHAKKDDK